MPRKASKRANGEGTISQRNDGRWEARLTTGYTSAGKQKRITRYGRTQAEALAKLEELKQQLANGTYSETRLKTDTYLDQWLEHKQRTLKPTTHQTYSSYVRHLKNHLEGIPLRRLKPLHIQTALHQIADTAGIPTANNCRRILHNALKQALRWQLITRNPVEAVDPFRYQPHEMTIWTTQQATRFLEHARTHRLHAAYYLAMATGMRRGELLGLRWTDITANIIHVRQTRVRAGSKILTSTPKTRTGERRIAIATDVLSVLEEHRNRQHAEKTLAAEAWTGTGLVLTDELGNGLTPHELAKTFQQLTRAAAVPQIRLHDLRHLHASMCIRNGMDPKTLADRLGHARASFTLDVYTHLYEEQEALAPVSLAAFLQPKSNRRSPN